MFRPAVSGVACGLRSPLLSLALPDGPDRPRWRARSSGPEGPIQRRRGRASSPSHVKRRRARSWTGAGDCRHHQSDPAGSGARDTPQRLLQWKPSKTKTRAERTEADLPLPYTSPTAALLLRARKNCPNWWPRRCPTVPRFRARSAVCWPCGAPSRLSAVHTGRLHAADALQGTWPQAHTRGASGHVGRRRCHSSPTLEARIGRYGRTPSGMPKVAAGRRKSRGGFAYLLGAFPEKNAKNSR